MLAWAAGRRLPANRRWHGFACRWVEGLGSREGVTEQLNSVPRIEQVLLILIDNAIAHTPPGGKVTVSAGDDGQWVRLAVSDTGSGIPAEDHAAVFERFARRDDARVRPGTGLGLAIARGIVEAHGGRLDLVSAPGEGAVFTVLLPRAPAR